MNMESTSLIRKKMYLQVNTHFEVVSLMPAAALENFDEWFIEHESS